jgi:hypothetical protein
MKAVVLFILLMGILLPVHSQLKVKVKCDVFTVDVLDGKINEVHSDYTVGQIKAKLPCFTSEDTTKCGDVINYKDRDVKFFTDRDYVEIGPAFKGKLSLPLMGGKRESFFKWLGLPKLKDDNWDAFETQYGCLILYYNAASRVRMIRFSSKTIDEINLCE